METKKINDAGCETTEVYGWQIQRGYVYRVDTSEAAQEYESGGETTGLGYHGNDVPPCGADYLYADNDELLVISREGDPSKIDCIDGVTLERVTLEAGDHRHDGTWEFRVLEVKRDGETILAGNC